MSHERALRGAFDSIDKDGNGTISRHEIGELLAHLNMHCSPARQAEIFDAMDINRVRAASLSAASLSPCPVRRRSDARCGSVP